MDLQERFKQKKITITFKIMDFLQNWLDKHILGTDKKYGPYLNSKGVKCFFAPMCMAKVRTKALRDDLHFYVNKRD